MPVHSWEDHGVSRATSTGAGGHSWEDDASSAGDDARSEIGGGSACEDASSSDGEPLAPDEAFIGFCTDLLLMRTLNARQYCNLMRLAAAAGITAASRHAFREGAPSGHYQRHLKDSLGIIGDSDKLYKLDVPAFSRSDLGRSVHTLYCFNPAELLHDDLVANPTITTQLREHIEDRALPPCYYSNELVTQHLEELVLPLDLYIDAVPYSHLDSAIGCWLINHITGQRYLFLVLRKRFLCQCGCRGWCTLYAVF